MKILVDTHTHSLVSGHAYSTVQEMAREASANGIQAFALTDHGPSMQGAPNIWYFGNLREIPAVLYGVRVIKGVEANIIDYGGSIDIPEYYLKRLEFVLASFHDVCIEPKDVASHTKAMVGALKNPYVDAVAHPGNPQFGVDIEEVVAAAKKYGKMIEINNHSFAVRKGSEENCFRFAAECKKQGVPVVCGSDAHISFSIGDFDKVTNLLEKVGVPEELVLCTSLDKFENYLEARRKRLESLKQVL